MMGAVIVYVNSFLLKRRKKELAVYMLLGMEPHLIFVKLMFETIGFTISALLSGLLFGIFGSQFVSVLTAKIFSVNFSDFHFIFSFNAFVKSLVYSGCVLCVISLFNYISIKKSQLIDLLHDKRSFEKINWSNNRENTLYLLMILISLLIGTEIVFNHSWSIRLGLMVVFIFISTPMVVLSLSKIIMWILVKKQSFILKKLRSFLLNECYCHLRTSLLSITIVTLFLTAAIGIFFF